MSRPKTRSNLPPRSDEKRKRCLDDAVSQDMLTARFKGIRYKGSSKHKRCPHLYGLEPFKGPRGDATLCDEHAGWQRSSEDRIPRLLGRARDAALVGSLIWTVDDNGWIYELQSTNSEQNEHHGYPLRPTDPFAEKIINRFATWAARHGTDQDIQAARACKARYDVKP